MEKVTTLIIAIIFILGVVGCGTQEQKEKAETEKIADQPEKPSVAEFHAYKAYHHTRYMVQTAQAAGGTNKLLHTKKLPTEGSDPVVTPALDHLIPKRSLILPVGL